VFQQFISDGAPRHRRSSWTKLNALLREMPGGRSPEIAYLSFLAAKQQKESEEAELLLSRAERSYAPRALRHVAFRHRMARGIRHDRDMAKLKSMAVASYPDPTLDHQFHCSIESMEAVFVKKGSL
jgi:hypothetical protein